jgi:membrane protein YqaA with SNARE-associated domain
MSIELLGGLFLGAAVSGVIPLVNAELLVVAAAAAGPPGTVLILALTTTLGQMVTKTGLYGVARWLPGRLPTKAREAVDRVSKRLAERQGAAGSTVFASAVLGIPPFYGVSLACGALRVRLRTFIIPGTVGRFVRFTALAWGGSSLLGFGG